jgi:hypothetical protein
MRTISKPHATWKPELSTNEREETLKFAAGSDKSLIQNTAARAIFTRTANEHAAEAKNGVGLDDKDRAVLKQKQYRLSPENRVKNKANTRAWRKHPENLAKHKANQRAWMKKPDNYAKTKARDYARIRAKSDALQVERAVESKAYGAGRTTDFGLGDISRADELECGAYDIINNPAGVLYPKGEATTANWIKDHGTNSIEEVLSSGKWAAYFFVTKQKITSGKEIKCRESTLFMTECFRDPLWRIETYRTKTQMFGRPGIGPRPKHIDKERDLRHFTGTEAKTVVRSYLLAKCVSAFDATGLESALQHYIETQIGMSHGLCLHKKAGAGLQKQYGKTKPETNFVALTLIRVTSPTFADVDPVDPNRSPPLTSCTVTSHDGSTTYKVAVRGDKQKFQGTKSVLADEATNAATRLHTSTRRKKRKADAMSRHEDTLSVQ